MVDIANSETTSIKIGLPKPGMAVAKALAVITTPSLSVPTPVLNITRAVSVQTILVSMNGPIMATNPSRTGSLVLAAPCAIGAVPIPASFENAARFMPVTKTLLKATPAAPPITAS